MNHHLYIVTINYIAPIEDIDKVLIPHREFLDQHYASGRFLASGPRIPRSGGIILARSASKDELLAILKADPFHIKGLAEYEIVEFELVKSAGTLADFFNNPISI